MSGLSLSSEENSLENINISEKSEEDELLLVGVQTTREKVLRKSSRDISPSSPFRKKKDDKKTFNDNAIDNSHNKINRTNTITPHKYRRNPSRGRHSQSPNIGNDNGTIL